MAVCSSDARRRLTEDTECKGMLGDSIEPFGGDAAEGLRLGKETIDGEELPGGDGGRGPVIVIQSNCRRKNRRLVTL